MASEDSSHMHPGAVLAQARQTQGVSQREVADALHLPLHVIDAIERGDKNELPAHVFTRGYVRAYAKLMDLEPNPLVATLAAQFGEDAQPTEEPVVPLAPPRSLNIPQLSVSQLFAVVGSILLTVIVLTWVLWPSSETAVQNSEAVAPYASTDASTAEPASQQPESDAPQAMSASAQDRVTQDRVTQDRVTQDRVDVQKDIVNVGGSAAESASAEKAELSMAGQGATSSEVAGEVSGDLSGAEAALGQNAPGSSASLADSIRVIVREDCWIEIKRADGSLLYGDLGRSGTTVDLSGQAPFSVLLGYAPGVDFEFNGERIPLAGHTRNNVAIFVIGQ